jgi:hypothetical protein
MDCPEEGTTASPMNFAPIVAKMIVRNFELPHLAPTSAFDLAPLQLLQPGCAGVFLEGATE